MMPRSLASSRLTPLDTDAVVPSFYTGSLCPQIDPEIFYPEKGGSTKAAKAVCAGCSVLEECREWALQNREPWGIWGGTSPRDRMKIYKERDREKRAAA